MRPSDQRKQRIFLLIVVLADELVHLSYLSIFSLARTEKSEFFYRSVKILPLLGAEISVGSNKNTRLCFFSFRSLWLIGKPPPQSWLFRKTKYLISNLLERKALPLNLLGKITSSLVGRRNKALPLIYRKHSEVCWLLFTLFCVFVFIHV